MVRLWLRWCNLSGEVIPTGAERANQLTEQTNHLTERADRLAERLRAMGINPDEV